MMARRVAAVCLVVLLALLAASARWHRDAGPAPVVAQTPLPPAASPSASGAVVLLARNITWSGSPGSSAPANAQYLFDSTPVRCEATDPVRLLLPAAALGAWSGRLRISAPGWKSRDVELPHLTPGAHFAVEEAITIERLEGTLTFRPPAGGLDYDRAELQWVRPLDDEPGAAPPPHAVALQLGNGEELTLTAPTGIYKLVLGSVTPARVRDFTAAAELPLRAGAAQQPFPLPETMSRRFIGYVGARRGPPGEAPVAVFCGVHLDVRAGRGELLLVFDKPKAPLELDYAALRPRPDNAWPISNLFLEDPARVSFDCPISHVDHRVVLDRADGRTTLLAQPLPPEDDRQLASLAQRMQALLKTQAQSAAANPLRFNARYKNVPFDKLPNFEHLQTLSAFSAYVRRVTDGPPQTVELFPRIRVLKSGTDGWQVEGAPAAGR